MADIRTWKDFERVTRPVHVELRSLPEITHEMIDAGACRLMNETEFFQVGHYSARSIAVAVYSVMARARPKSSKPINDSPVAAIETLNGRVQVSNAGTETVGLLVERGGYSAGTLLSQKDAEHLAKLLSR